MNATVDSMPATKIEGPMAWTLDSLAESSWLLPVPKEVTEEILVMLESIRRSPGPFQTLSPSQFALGRTRAFMEGPVRTTLDQGIGICVLNRLPTERMSTDEARAVYWVVSSLLGRPVAQKHNGNMMADVKDAGIPMKAGSAARGSTSRELLEFHNDGANTPLPPQYVGLLMLHEPKSGGLSRAFSVISGYNWLLEHHPDVLPRLHADFKYFRMREHDPAEPQCMSAPFLRFDGNVLKARVGPYQMKSAFEMGEADLDDATADAIAALDELFAQDDLVAEFYMSPGQLQFVNNQVIVHSRTEFIDNDEEGKRRHLLRIWLRDQGDPTYNGR